MQIQSVIPESAIRLVAENSICSLLNYRGRTMVIHPKTQAIVSRVLTVARGANADAGQNGQSGYVMHCPFANQGHILNTRSLLS
jgi:hypothetical protein